MELQGNGQRRWSFAQGPAPKKYLIRPMREESLNILQEGLHQGPHGFQVSSYPPEQTKKVVIKKDSPRQEETPGYLLQLPSLLESADQACCNMVSNVSASTTLAVKMTTFQYMFFCGHVCPIGPPHLLHSKRNPSI